MRTLPKLLILAGCVMALVAVQPAAADDLACVSTTFRFIGANDKVCVSAFDDPKVDGCTTTITVAARTASPENVTQQATLASSSLLPLPHALGGDS